jgi:hypothetical protein
MLIWKFMVWGGGYYKYIARVWTTKFHFIFHTLVRQLYVMVPHECVLYLILGYLIPMWNTNSSLLKFPPSIIPLFIGLNILNTHVFTSEFYVQISRVWSLAL